MYVSLLFRLSTRCLFDGFKSRYVLISIRRQAAMNGYRYMFCSLCEYSSLPNVFLLVCGDAHVGSASYFKAPVFQITSTVESWKGHGGTWFGERRWVRSFRCLVLDTAVASTVGESPCKRPSLDLFIFVHCPIQTCKDILRELEILPRDVYFWHGIVLETKALERIFRSRQSTLKNMLITFWR